MATRIIREIVEPFITDSNVSDLVRMRFNGIEGSRYYRLEDELTKLCMVTRTIIPSQRPPVTHTR